MGRLRRAAAPSDTGQAADPSIVLRAVQEIGRSYALGRDDPQLSAVHAVISWDGEHWWIRDCGSTNGTRVNELVLDARARHRLQPGDALTMGRTHFVVDDVEPPGLWLTGVGHPGEIHVPFTERDALLPTAEAPAATVWRTADGTWMFENGRDPPWPLVPGSEVTLRGLTFRADPPRPLAPTAQSSSVAQLLSVMRADFEIAVSPSEEEADVTIFADGKVHRIPERASAYLLAVLARARGADESRGGGQRRPILGDADGWLHIEDARRETGADEELLAVHVHRLRKRLRKLGFADAEQVIERRNRRMRLAIAPSRVRIVTRD